MRSSYHSSRRAAWHGPEGERPPRCFLQSSILPLEPFGITLLWRSSGKNSSRGNILLSRYLVSSSHRAYGASSRNPSMLTSQSTLQHAMGRSEVVVRQSTSHSERITASMSLGMILALLRRSAWLTSPQLKTEPAAIRGRTVRLENEASPNNPNSS
jgi:hypothetical protein